LNQDFSSYVRSLTADTEPDPAEVTRTLLSLRKILRVELDRRGLLRVSPACLGVFGWDNWTNPEGGSSDALDELAADCYTFTFVRRLQALKAQLLVKPNIEGLVVRNVRNFLYDRNKRFDPIGFRIFEAIQKAVRTAVGDGRLWIIEGELRVGSSTVFCAAREDTEEVTVFATTESVETLASLLANELMPELVTARGKARASTLAALSDQLSHRLTIHPEPQAYRFQEFVAAFKSEVRSRWFALLEDDLGETSLQESDDGSPERVRSVIHESDLEDRDWVARLSTSVDRVLDRLEERDDTRRDTRKYLDRLWYYARGVALEPGWEPDTAPSRRQLARELEIPRDRLNELGQQLRDIVEQVRAEELGPTDHASRAVIPRGHTR